MRALRTGTLLLACFLAACGHTHTAKVTPATVPPPQPSRPLVSIPGPGELPLIPVPELKPGTEVTAVPAATDNGGQTEAPTGTDTGSQTGAPAVTGSGSQTEAPTAPSTAAVPNTPAAAPAANYDPDRLVGLSEAEATNLLGPPVEKTDSPPSRVWTYRSETCEVKLFFYPEVGGTTYRTLTYEISDSDPSDTTHGGCVGGLVKAHAG